MSDKTQSKPGGDRSAGLWHHKTIAPRATNWHQVAKRYRKHGDRRGVWRRKTVWCAEFEFAIEPPSNKLRAKYPNLVKGLWALSDEDAE
jgi:hypothetical protein